MRNIIAIITLTIILLTSTLVYSSNKKEIQLDKKYYISKSLINVNLVSISSSYGNYTFTFENILNENEMVYKNNVIVFNIDGTTYPFIFDLSILLSNKGVEEKVIVSVPRVLLIKIVDSNESLIKIGGNRNSQIDSEYKDLIVDLLEKTKS